MFLWMCVGLFAVAIALAVCAPNFIDSLPPAFGSCPNCGEPLDKRGYCRSCGTTLRRR